MKKRNLLIPGLVLVWLLLAVLLVRLESETGSIQTMGDVVWYSLVTLTTVGYGDLYPVTAAGKVIGGIFVLMSTGFVTFLICVVIASVTGQLIPALRLRLHRKQLWHIFTDCSEGSIALMTDLLKNDRSAVVILTVPCEETLPEGVICLQRTVSSLLELKGNDNCCVFCLTDDPQQNYRKARSLSTSGADIYCQTSYAPDTIHEKLHLFDADDNCARSYWGEYPLDAAEQTIVLIGFDRRGQKILERGLLTNVGSGTQPIQYHIFGDSESFRSLHHALEQIAAINDTETDRDCIHFHNDNWSDDAKLLEQADRIIICGANDAETLTIVQDLRRFFPICGKLHCRLRHALEDTCTFGSDEDLYTEELVLGRRLNRIAMQLHEIYCSGVPDADSWSDLSEFKRQSNIAAADHLLTKIRYLLQDDRITNVTAEAAARAYRVFAETEDKMPLRKLEHERWMRFHLLHNWRYAPVRDNALRMHPLLVPFETLSYAEQVKDDYPWELLGELKNIL